MIPENFPVLLDLFSNLSVSKDYPVQISVLNIFSIRKTKPKILSTSRKKLHKSI